MAKIDLTQIKGIKIRDYAIRFLFGGAVSILAVLIEHWTNQRIGGIFTTFPAILLASLTLIGQQAGKEQAEADAQGGVVGAIALVVAALVLSLTLSVLPGVWALLVTLLVWLACGVGLYFVCVKLGWLKGVEG